MLETREAYSAERARPLSYLSTTNPRVKRRSNVLREQEEWCTWAV
jgi:hypothetical protein